MFCPNCGFRNSTEQKFCRSCGLNLERSAESLLEQLPTAGRANVLRNERRLDKFGDFAWNSFALTVLFAIGSLASHVIAGTQIWFDGILAALVLFASLGIAHRVINQRLELKKRSERGIVMDQVPRNSDEFAEPENTTRELELDSKSSVH